MVTDSGRPPARPGSPGDHHCPVLTLQSGGRHCPTVLQAAGMTAVPTSVADTAQTERAVAPAGDGAQAAAIELTLLVPAYNESKNIGPFLDAVLPVLQQTGVTFEVLFVNDGSRDDTLGLLAAACATHPQVRAIGLARNFGKEIAMTAGLAHARGQAVIPIDCDLQHPPELIPQFIAAWRAGFDMVVGVRAKRDEEGWFRKKAARTYYRLMRKMTSVEIPPNAGDFRLIDRKIVDVILQMPERHRFMKGIFAWPGFKVTSIDFAANPRANAGNTWSFWKLWRFALDGLFSFSTVPLKMWTYVGLLTAAGAFLYGIITIVQKLVFGIEAPGYASLLILLLFFNGLSLISNGIQGEYIGRIFEEVKRRPLWVVQARFGFSAEELAACTPITAAIPSRQNGPHAS